jgi:3-hydroxyisobutyrate dehydrogenase-like beta-hydroxyacid dehydrogenase
MVNLGYIGLGAMGGPMAARLLPEGHTVTGYNRTRSKAQWLLDRGMIWADSPRAVAEAADTVWTVRKRLRRAVQLLARLSGVIA